MPNDMQKAPHKGHCGRQWRKVSMIMPEIIRRKLVEGFISLVFLSMGVLALQFNFEAYWCQSGNVDNAMALLIIVCRQTEYGEPVSGLL